MDAKVAVAMRLDGILFCVKPAQNIIGLISYPSDRYKLPLAKKRRAQFMKIVGLLQGRN